MVSIYEKQNDLNFVRFQRVSSLSVISIGLVGLLVIVLSVDLNLTFGVFTFVYDNFINIILILIPLTIVTLFVGFIQVLFTSKLGEEIIMLVIWLTPFVVVATSVYLYLNSNDINLLGGAIVGLVFLAVIIYTRHSIRLSARLIEVGAEIVVKNMVMFGPQLRAFLFTTIITILMIPGVMISFAFGLKIHPVLSIIFTMMYEFMYLFVISSIRAFADANNISYVNQWYTKKPSSSDARKQVAKLRAPIYKYAFIMAFISRFRSNRQNKFTPFTLFKYMNIRDWPNLLLNKRRKTNTADVVAYFGSYSLVIVISKNMRSITQAYKESAKTVFKSFAANIAGSMGFNILEGMRVWLSAAILTIFGYLYAYSLYGDVLTAIIIAILFLILGMTPLNSMFKPVVNAYRLLIYRSYTGKPSSKLDKKTRDIIRAAIKK